MLETLWEPLQQRLPTEEWEGAKPVLGLFQGSEILAQRQEQKHAWLPLSPRMKGRGVSVQQVQPKDLLLPSEQSTPFNGFKQTHSLRAPSTFSLF